MKKVFLAILFLLSTISVSFSQVTINTSINKDSLYIGEEFELSISISSASFRGVSGIDFSQYDSIISEVKVSSLPDSILKEAYAEFEWPRDDNYPDRIWPLSGFVKQGNMLLKTMAVRVWDVGVYSLPHLSLVQDSASQKLVVQHLQSPVIRIYPPPDVKPIDTTEMIMPISHIIEEPKTWEDFVWLVYLLAGLITLGLILYMIYRSKYIEEEEVEVIEVIRPAHELGIEKLIELKEKELWQQGKIKEYQSELTYIIREYLENRFGIQALESTTDEILRSLKGTEFNTAHEQNLKEILQIADLVKFAKAKPEEEIHSVFMEQAIDLVEQTKKIISLIESTDGDTE